MTFDSRSFRDALGLFVTGVTVITARSPSGKAVGVTANSFNSVSIDPPLILWSLAETSSSLPAFNTSEFFAVHILREDQSELAKRFATSGIDKFEGIATIEGDGNVPLIDDCAARIECRTWDRHPGGDHIIFVGEVLRITADHDASPLLYHGGKFAGLRDKNKES